MAHSKMYRNFIILQEDENHHSGIGDKALSGYAKIEAKSEKCKISFYAQNLNKNDKYTIVLICYKKDVKQIVDLGTLDVTDIGKGEACKEYYINNIAGLDFSYEKISGAAICKHKDGKMSFVMYGFMNGENVKDDWKKCKVVKQGDNEKIEPIKEEKYYKKDYHCEEKHDDHDDKKCDDHHKDDHKYDDDHKHDDDYKCDDNHKHDDHKHDDDYKYDDNHKHDDHKYDDDHKHDDNHKHDDDHDHHDHDEHKEKKCDDEYKECKEKCKEYKKECEHKEDHKDASCQKCGRDEDIASKFEKYENDIENTREELDPYDFEMRGAIGDFFNEIVKGFEEIKNKFKDIEYCKWYKVNVNSLDDMCNTTNYNKYTVAYYPMLNYFPYIQKYGFFMLGYKCDSKGNLKYIVYAVPGKKDKEDQPYAGKTGFVTWMSDGDKSIGFWLMFYDFKTSTVVVPMK